MPDVFRLLTIIEFPFAGCIQFLLRVSCCCSCRFSASPCPRVCASVFSLFLRSFLFSVLLRDRVAGSIRRSPGGGTLDRFATFSCLEHNKYVRLRPRIWQA